MPVSPAAAGSRASDCQYLLPDQALSSVVLGANPKRSVVGRLAEEHHQRLAAVPRGIQRRPHDRGAEARALLRRPHGNRPEHERRQPRPAPPSPG